MNRTNLLVMLLISTLSFAAGAQETDPNDQDPTLPNKGEVVCGATATYVSASLGATSDSNTGFVFKLEPVPNSPDRRMQTRGTIKLDGNVEFSFALTMIPDASNLVRGEDLLTMNTRFTRRETAERVKVLGETMETSDQLTNFGELNARRIDIPVRTRFYNPEVSTVLANSKRPLTAQEAVRTGQLPDGVVNAGTFNCYIRVGKAGD